MSTEPFLHSLVVSDDDAGQRLDRLLGQRHGDVSRSRFRDLIAAGRVMVDGKTIVEPSRRVKPGETVAFSVPDPVPAQPQAEAIALSVVFEDDHVIVIDKPAGLVVHPGHGNWTGTLVNALIAHCGTSLAGIGGERRPGIVHRLDKDTSGVMVVAKTDQAHRGLAEQFAAHGRDGRLVRAYIAVVWGRPPRHRGVIEAAVGRKLGNRTKMDVVRQGPGSGPGSGRGRAAVTRYEVLQTFPVGETRPRASLVKCVLETGRTHQIRVHMAHIGHPLLGDAAYGSGFKASAGTLGAEAQAALAALNRQALHAAEIGFVHPATGERMRFEVPPPGDFAELLAALRVNGGPAGQSDVDKR
jgi:23S rRNA pseudouridine1911/1915/1917 synthase